MAAVIFPVPMFCAAPARSFGTTLTANPSIRPHEPRIAEQAKIEHWTQGSHCQRYHHQNRRLPPKVEPEQIGDQGQRQGKQTE